MTNLVIDIGNTTTKVAIFNNRDLVRQHTFSSFTLAQLSEILASTHIENAIISSVNTNLADFEELLSSNINYYRFTTSIPAGLNNHYKTPQTLGLDRYAAVIGAKYSYPDKNCLVIDAGTCITYDFIDFESNYWGGSISPGINMRFKAMHDYTKRLPLLQIDTDNTASYGLDTLSAMHTGVQQGIVNEALGFIQYYTNEHTDLHVLLCGGDYKFFDSRLKNSIFAHALKPVPHLVLVGLNQVIHQYND